MASFLNVTVLATSSGAVSPSQQYLLGFSQVVQIKAATTKQIASYPGAGSVITVSKPVNNVHEQFDYVVSQSMTTLAAL